MNNIFGDMITKEEMEKAKKELYPIRRSFYKLENEVANATVGLEELLSSIKKAKESALNDPSPKDVEYIEKIKQEFDKVVYLIEDFVGEFHDSYKELYPTYAAEKIAGSFQQDTNYAIGIDASVSLTNQNVGWNKKSGK